MSNGIIKRVTPKYNLRIPIFDGPGWGREVERNFDVIDAVMFSFSGFGVGGAWTNSTPYEPNDRVIDGTDGSIWLCLVSHVSASSGTFADDRVANPTYWKVVSNFVQSTGPWQASFSYRTNDYMYDNHRYGIALRDFTSTTSYDDDVFDGNILTLIDLQSDLQSAQANANTASGAASQALGAQFAAEIAQSDAEDARDIAVQAANNLTFMYSNFAGGTTGQVLAKASGTDYDYQWVALPGGGDMLQAVYDTNGLGLDVYARANHTGVQSMSTITGLDQEIIDLWADIGTRVPNTRTVTAGSGLSGGGNLSGNISLAVDFGTAAGTVAAGNDSRIVNALSPTVIHALTAKAPPADADEFVIVDSAASWVGKKLSWSAVKAALSNVFLPKAGGTMTGDIDMDGNEIENADVWGLQPIGVPIPLLDNLVGTSAPPTDRSYRYIKLTASDAYNSGVLTGQSVSGSAPLVVATADIDLADSPINGQTVNLINTERRFLRAGGAGTLQDSAFESHKHIAGLHGISSARYGQATGLPNMSLALDYDNSIDLRNSTASNFTSTEGTSETRPKNIGVTYFMRVL